MRIKIREYGQKYKTKTKYGQLCFGGFVKLSGFVGFEILTSFPFQQPMSRLQLVLVTWTRTVNAENSMRRHKDTGLGAREENRKAVTRQWMRAKI